MKPGLAISDNTNQIFKQLGILTLDDILELIVYALILMFRNPNLDLRHSDDLYSMCCSTQNGKVPLKVGCKYAFEK